MSRTTVTTIRTCEARQKCLKYRAIQKSLIWIMLWAGASFLDTCQVQLKPNFATLNLKFTHRDVLLMGFASWLLNEAIHTRNWKLCVPWLTFSCVNLYFNHLWALKKVSENMRYFRGSKIVSWLGFGVMFVSACFKAEVIWTVMKMCYEMWIEEAMLLEMGFY